jgi:hypothetical protein
LAEEVEIGNVGGEGGVASEATLKDLVKAVQRMAAKTGMDPKKEGAKIQETYNKAQQEGVDVQTKYREELEENTEAVEKSTDAFKSSRSMLGLVGNALGSIIGSATGLFGEFVSGGNRLSDFAQHLPIVGGYLSSVTGYLDETMDAFRMVSAVGAGMGNSMMDVRIAAGQAAMPLMEFASFLQQNNIALQALGGGATAGARSFATLSKELREGAGADLLNLGFTIEDLNEGLADFATIQSREIGRERVNRNELINDTVTYLTELDKLSRLTGLSRKQMQEEMAANSRDIRVRTARARMTDDQQIRFDANLAVAGAQSAKLGEVLRDMADGRPDEALTRRLFSQSATFRQFAGEIENMSPERMQEFMVDVNREIESFATSMGTGVEALDGPFQEMFGLSADLSTLARMTKEEREQALAEANRRDKVTTALADFESRIAKVRLIITESLIDSGLFENMADLIQDFSDALSGPRMQGAIRYFVGMVTKFGNKFINFLKELPEDPAEAFGELADGLMGLLGDALSGLGSILGKAFLDALTSPAFIAASAAAIVGYLGAMKFKDMIAGALGMGGGATRGGATRGADQTMGGGIGKNIGGFIGGLGEGIMKGFAAGLTAFANPLILKGAAIFSAALLLIGGAIAGVGYLLGLAAPTIADGFKEFNEIDGSNLIKVGGGIAAVAGALALFGVGSVISSLGNLAGGILDGIGSFFGNKSPLEKITESAAAFEKLDGERVKQGAQGVAAMAVALGGMNGMSSGGFSGFVNALTGYDPTEMAENVVKISDMFEDINGRQLAASSIGVGYLAEALSIFNEGSFNNLGAIMRNWIFDPTDFATNIVVIAKLFEEIQGRQLAAASIGVGYLAEAMSIFNEGSFNNLGSIIRNWMFDPTDFATNIVIISKLFEDINGRQLAAASIGVGYLAEAMSIFNEGSFNNLGAIMRNWIFDPTDFATNIVVIAKLFEEIQGRQLAQASIGVGYLAEAMSIFNEGSFNNLSSIVRQFLFDPTGFGQTIYDIAKLFEDIQGRQLAQASIGVGYMVEALEIFNDGNFTNLKTKASQFLFDPTPMGTTIKTIAKDFEEISGRNLAQASIGVAYMSEALEIFTESTGFKGIQTILGYLTPDSTKVGERIRSIADSLSGVDGTMLQNVSPGIIALSQALTAFGSGNFSTVMESVGATFLNWFSGDESNIADTIVDMSNKLAGVDSEALTASAEGVGALTSNLMGFKDLLDTDGVISYNVALTQLVETLERMNEVLAEDNDGLFKDRMSAGEALGQIGTTNAASSAGITELNSTMQRILTVLEKSDGHIEQVQRHTRGLSGNLQRGGVIPHT